MTVTIDKVAISLGLGCENQSCLDFASPLYLQLTRGRYDLCSVMEMPRSIGAWRDEHRTARKRANRAQRLGYEFREIDRVEFNDDIFTINTSLAMRQGRAMTPAYQRHNDFAPLPDYECPRHAVRTYGVVTGEVLVAYLWLYRVGDLALVSSILGHGEMLADDIMYLLVQGTIEAQAELGGCLVYNRHDSGTDGLRYFKERLGLAETGVEWTT